MGLEPRSLGVIRRRSTFGSEASKVRKSKISDNYRAKRVIAHRDGLLEAEIKNYAVLAAACLVSSLSEKEQKSLNSVILFGSAARGAATEESDIDLFFDVDMPLSAQKSLKAKLNKAAEQFYTSNTGFEYKLRGISNEISIIVGRIGEWADLSQSIAASGIVLYGKYTARPPKLKAYTILSWEKPGKAKGALLNKIYGYKALGKRYPGLLAKKGGIKLGKGAIMVPAASKGDFISVFEKYEVSYSQHEVWA